jgi:hypothetical protein
VSLRQLKLGSSCVIKRSKSDVDEITRSVSDFWVQIVSFSLDEKLTIFILQYLHQLKIGLTDTVFDHRAFHRYEVRSFRLHCMYSLVCSRMCLTII